MTFIREDVRQEDWEFFNALNIQYMGEHITADKYSDWVIDRKREIIFTTICWGGRDYGKTYILIWEKARVYIYVESRPTELSDGTIEFRWYIKNIEAPLCLKGKKDELISLIRKVAEIKYEGESGGIFVITSIADPQFREGE